MMQDVSKDVRDITFILGPPGPEKKKQFVAQMSTTSGKQKDKVWLELVHAILHELTKHEPSESQNELDKILSIVVETSVRVNDPFISFYYDSREGFHPTIVLDPKKITGPAGEMVEIDCSVKDWSDAVANVLGYLLETEWVRNIIAYQ